MNNSIDCIFDIQDKYVALIKRAKEPFKGFWALPGGRQLGNEKPFETVVREMAEEIGVKINVLSEEHIPTPVEVFGKTVYLNQIWTYDSGSDPRGGNTIVHALALDFEPEKVKKSLRKGDSVCDVGIFDKNYLPELAFDHRSFIHDYFKKLKRYQNPIPTTDVIIEYNDCIVLVERKNPPYGLALPGGFAELGLSLEENAVKEAKEETGLDVILENPEKPFCVHSNPDRDPRFHMISVVYIAKGQGKLKAGDDAKKVMLYTPYEIVDLIAGMKIVFDHPRILTKYLIDRGYS